MKLKAVFCVALLLNGSFGYAQNLAEKPKKPEDQIEQYWLILIKSGPKNDFDSSAKAKLFEGHMANINKLYYDGILKAAGPFGANNNQWRGLFGFDCTTREEAERYVQTDPAVAAGLFSVEITPWYTAPVGNFKKGKPGKVN